MQWQLIFLSIAPVVTFVVADRLGARRRAIVLALVVSSLEFVYNSLTLGFVELFSLGSLALFVVLGGLSIKSEALIFFKLQPVAFEVSIAVTFLFYTVALDTPLLSVILLDHVEINEWVPLYQQGYAEIYAQSMSRSMPFLLLVHAALTAYAARQGSISWWFHCRVLGLYSMIVALFFGERILQASY